ncbi:hypothetical protein HRG_001463 [Hirsutella rhossiliensis]|uniref:Uncharacterized protein n=1 Tax=Hirsutella rhossiliensis TaxID=111463 RepID=A0A9P8SN94_9HYPO|nr:uncharacterized protein HRG_01463 [Hirsutella rhossiliensis]KAH0968821.1 hypothetical protein HRG_01463 [Hirsutella rhossiliensis]
MVDPGAYRCAGGKQPRTGQAGQKGKQQAPEAGQQPAQASESGFVELVDDHSSSATPIDSPSKALTDPGPETLPTTPGQHAAAAWQIPTPNATLGEPGDASPQSACRDSWMWDFLGSAALTEYESSMDMDAGDAPRIPTDDMDCDAAAEWTAVDNAPSMIPHGTDPQANTAAAMASGNMQNLVATIPDSALRHCSHGHTDIKAQPAPASACSTAAHTCLQQLTASLYNLSVWAGNHQAGPSNSPSPTVDKFLAVQKDSTELWERLERRCGSCISRREVAQLLLLNVEQLTHLHVAVAAREGVGKSPGLRTPRSELGKMPQPSNLVGAASSSSEQSAISVGSFVIEDAEDRDIIIGQLLHTRALKLARFIKAIRNTFMDNGHDDCCARLGLLPNLAISLSNRV